jgi:hypothetical protein
MSLEEKFEKETGKRILAKHGEMCYSEDFVNWLKEKLTWKKFTEQEPDTSKDIICREKSDLANSGYYYSNYDHAFMDNISLHAYEKFLKETEWMYAPN